MDLVEVAPTARPPVCKIMDYGKWRYQQQKKEDKSRASSRGGQLKEIKFRTVKIGDHDLMIKVNHAREFLKEGNKVQFTLQGPLLANGENGWWIDVPAGSQILSVRATSSNTSSVCWAMCGAWSTAPKPRCRSPS